MTNSPHARPALESPGERQPTRSRILIGVALVVSMLAAWSVGHPGPARAAAADTPTPAPAEGLGEVTGEVAWEPCPFQAPGITIECGALTVPADRDDPDAGVVRLRFGIVRAAAAPSDEDDDGPGRSPVVYLSGGPGQSALELVPVAFGRLFGPLARDRDLILLDQRGTGYSEPSLSCDEYTTWATGSLSSDLPPEEQAEQATEVLEDCRLRLLDEGVDLAHYDSQASAADLEDLRTALGYEEWDLYGLSYGTRLALTAMRDHPDGIRSVILDAAYPLEVDLYAETPSNLARALEAFFGACETDPACSTRFPDLEDRFTRLVEELNDEPVSVTVIVPTTGEQVPSTLNGDSLVGFLFQSLYITDLVQFLPEIVAAVDEGEYDTIGLLQGSFLSELDYVSIGQQLAVQCNEEIAFTDEGELAAAAANHPLLEGYFRSAPTIGPALVELCQTWTGADAAASTEDEAVASDIPTLILAGELDPITPPRWGAAIEQDLGNAAFYEFPDTGHGAVPARDCAASMVEAFLDDPAATIDAGCIGDIPAPPFTPDDVAVEMVPFTSPSGFEGLRPDAWDEVLPGVFQESPLIALIQQALPGLTEGAFLQQVAAQLRLPEPPEPVGELQGDGATWNLYEFQNLGQRVAAAITEHDGSLLIVQLATTPLRHDVYYEQAFVPAVEALVPAAS